MQDIQVLNMASGNRISLYVKITADQTAAKILPILYNKIQYGIVLYQRWSTKKREGESKN